MAIARNITQSEAIPHEPNEWVEFRKLSHVDLSRAAEVRQEAVFRKFRAMGGEVLGYLQGVETPDGQEADPMESYDRATLLHTAIARWSYEEKPNADNIDQLDEPTARWALDVIAEMNGLRPSEDATKNA